MFPLSHSPCDWHDKVWGGSPVCLMFGDLRPPCVMWQQRLSGVDTLWLASLASHTKIRLRKELNWFACWFWNLNVEWYHIEAFVNAWAFPLHMQRCGSLYGTPPALHWLILTRVSDSLTPSRWAPGTGQWTSSHLGAVAWTLLFTPWAHLPSAWQCIEGVDVCFK